jgi:hypothetical protein
VSYAPYLLDAEPAPSKTKRVLAVASGAVADGASVWQRVLNDNRVSANKRMLPNATELMYARIRSERRVVFYYHVAGKSSSIREYNVAADATVVRNVSLGHDQVVIADFRQVPAPLGTALKSRELPERVALSRAQPASFAPILAILRGLTGGDKGIED